MLRAFLPPTTPGYRPLPSRPAEVQVGFKGTVVCEAQLSCSYITLGGKKPHSGAENRKTLNRLMRPT